MNQLPVHPGWYTLQLGIIAGVLVFWFEKAYSSGFEPRIDSQTIGVVLALIGGKDGYRLLVNWWKSKQGEQ